MIKNLNPEIQLKDYDGKITRVEYIEDWFKKIGVYDSQEGHGVLRLNQKLTPEEWSAVKGQFKNYNRGWFKWGTAKPDIVISILTKMRKPEVERVVVRHKLTEKYVDECKKSGVHIKDGVTGNYIF